MIGAVVAVVAGYGAFLLYTGAHLGWRGLGPSPRPATAALGRWRGRARDWVAQAGLAGASPFEVAGATGSLAALGALGAFTLFGGWLAPAVAAALAGFAPVLVLRQRRQSRREAALDAWPRMIEEIRVLTSSAGRSIPQALFEVGLSAGRELSPAFEAARREWRLSTDFSRATAVLKEQLADPTADAACETLLVAHELGGTDLTARLDDLAQDRRVDVSHRRDARARQAGARFARRFVVVVPLGMAAAGLSVGSGRDAYETPAGQAAVALALGVMAACWVWAGQVMRLPDEERVFR